MPEEIFTLRDIAALLKVAEKTVYRLAQRGEIPCFKVGGQWRCRHRDLEAWIEARSPGNTERTSPAAHGTDATRAVRLTDREELTRHRPSVTDASLLRISLFDDFELDERLGELRQAGQPLEVEPKVFDVLSYLIRHRARVVPRDELLKHLWPGQVVIEAALTRCVAEIRKAVHDDGVQQQVIKTQRGRGYRFVAAVTERAIPVPHRDAPPERLYPSKDNQPVLAPPNNPSIAALPFVNLSGDPAQDYFSDTLTEDLITDLAKLSGLSVVTGNSSFSHKSKVANLAAVNRELGTQYVLTGGVRTANKRMLITVQLTDGATGHLLWAERYDRLQHDVFALQEEVRRKIVVHLGLTLTDTADRWIVDREYTGNPEAFDALWRGWESYNRFMQEGNAHARQLFERAVALDPMYAPAYMGLGWTYWLEWTWQWNRDPQTLNQTTGDSYT